MVIDDARPGFTVPGARVEPTTRPCSLSNSDANRGGSAIRNQTQKTVMSLSMSSSDNGYEYLTTRFKSYFDPGSLTMNSDIDFSKKARGKEWWGDKTRITQLGEIWRREVQISRSKHPPQVFVLTIKEKQRFSCYGHYLSLNLSHLPYFFYPLIYLYSIVPDYIEVLGLSRTYQSDVLM
mmetsp:Transcript_5659/g.11307  ORF Transcript_5659/g.11307 Transcript_5659/m.11307 type:complete len:179 (-) Transcript_5659:99-635(-)